MTIYHTHHIIPRHMGGTDDPSNLVKLTVEEHAEAHKKLWEEHRHWQDKLAWQGLSGMIDKQEIIKQKLSESGKKGCYVIKSLPKDPIQQGIKARNMWQLPGMREYLIEKRKEQSRLGKNPMQGKKQKRVCCINCRKEIAVNVIGRHRCHW